MSRYKIWDKTETIYTPVGEILTPAEWLTRYPWGNLPGAKIVISGELVNGGFCGELSQMKTMYTKMGAAITDTMTDDEVLAAIENCEDNPSAANTVTTEERTAAALEILAMASLPDTTEA